MKFYIWTCVPFANCLICHKQYVEKIIFKVWKLGYQICFGSKSGSKWKNAKIDIHIWTCVPFAHCMICHKQYVEKIIFKVQKLGYHRSLNCTFGSNWSLWGRWSKIELIICIGLIFMSSLICHNPYLRNHNFFTHRREPKLVFL